jgi:hypothetical protein
MLQFRFEQPAALDARDQFVISPHHPDRLRRPSPRGAAGDRDRFQQALTWNVFRTLELVAPAYWLRRFHTRLVGQPSLVAPQIVQVQLWRALPLPPILQIDGAHPDVTVDVVIETEHDVWTLIVPRQGEVSNIQERAVHVIDAGAWLAGARAHHCGVIECDGDNAKAGSLLKSRYARSRDSAALRSASRGPAAPTTITWGVMEWSDLAAILLECSEAPNLPPIERTLARNAMDWLQVVGIEPTR